MNLDNHPCASHIQTCDHCALCEAGACCAGLSTAQKVQLLDVIRAERRAAQFHTAVAAEAQRQASQLREAIAAEAARTFSLADLMHIESERQVLGAPLPGAAWSLPAVAVADLPAATDAGQPAEPVSPQTRREAAYVPVARES